MKKAGEMQARFHSADQSQESLPVKSEDQLLSDEYPEGRVLSTALGIAAIESAGNTS